MSKLYEKNNDGIIFIYKDERLFLIINERFYCNYQSI